MEHYHKSSLKLLLISILILIVIANSIILLSDPFNRTRTALWMMNISAAVASSLGIIAIYRYGIHDLHGKSIMCVTIGLIFWFAADLSLLYSHYTHGKEEMLVSSTDGLWFMGYIFLALHLSIILRSLRNERNTYDPSSRTQTKIVIILIVIIATAFVIFNMLVISLSESFTNPEERVDFQALIVTIAYPVLDLILIVPSILILITLRNDIRHYVPWLLSSLSLLLSAIADDGYVIDYVNGNFRHLVFWDLFYVTDFIIMAGALFWYNRYHIISGKKSSRTMEVEP
jgi:hypothetical protein